MGTEEFIEKCKNIIGDYLLKTGTTIKKESIFVVWSCKILQNNKALLSTNLKDGMYYEITYNGDKKELYLDAYKKLENICYEIYEIGGGLKNEKR